MVYLLTTQDDPNITKFTPNPNYMFKLSEQKLYYFETFAYLIAN